MSRTTIHNITVKSEQLAIDNKDRGVPEIVEYTLKNTSAATASICRIFFDYLPVQYLYCETSDIKTDQYIVPEFLINRFRTLPIIQSDKPIPLNLIVGTLNVKNTSNKEISVYSKDIKFKNGPNLTVNDRSRLLILEPNKYIDINIRIAVATPLYTAATTNKSSKINFLSLAYPLQYKMLDYRRISVLHDNELDQFFTNEPSVIKQSNSDKILYYTNKDERVSDFIKETSDSINKLDEYFNSSSMIDEKKLYKTENMHPEEFFISFKTYGTVKAKKIFLMAIEDTINVIKNMTFQYDDKFIAYLPSHYVYLLYDELKSVYPGIKIFFNVAYNGYNENHLYIDAKYDEAMGMINEVKKKIIGMFNNMSKEISMLKS